MSSTRGQLEELCVRATGQRSRKVWVKARPLRSQMFGASDKPGIVQTIFINAVSQQFRWMHWALEAGPWTFEVALDGKASRRMTIRRVHRNQQRHEWDSEINRVCVGETSMTDGEMEECRQQMITSCTEYDVNEQNCQTVAADLAIRICNGDGFDTWDRLQEMVPFSSDAMTSALFRIHLMRDDVGLIDMRLINRSLELRKKCREHQSINQVNDWIGQLSDAVYGGEDKKRSPRRKPS